MYRISGFGIILLYITCIGHVFAQNLVKNPSFETYNNCPQRLGNFNDDVLSWSTPSKGSTDYFNGCSSAMGTPKNFNGDQPADFGKGYAGLYVYAPEDYREYLQGELSQTLEPGRKYHISFYISLAEQSDFAVKEFGLVFSKNKLEFTTKKELSKGVLYKNKENKYRTLEIGYADFYSDTQDWVWVHTDFVAKGWERFMTIGNFKNNARTRLFKTKRSAKKGAYYYIDMVKVESTKKINTEEHFVGNDVDDKIEGIELDQLHVFENVLFEFDRFQLLGREKVELRKIFQYLENDTALRIHIHGHTDTIGSITYNQNLSNERAKSVADYLIHLGLPQKRILWNGHGGTKPVADNATEAGRKQNRRVEFVISRQE
ncbi:OmpA family protein [Ulvibacterium marinum]|uniref:OmpA family protein n=1 Tax=Ulvibacterium marinum TaxID=2419782 RepID=UPI002493FE4F|nr:OmpA family protein [Ulvibacterium marinum]